MSKENPQPTPEHILDGDSSSLESDGNMVESSDSSVVANKPPRQFSQRTLLIAGVMTLVVLVGIGLFAALHHKKTPAKPASSGLQTQTISQSTLKQILANGGKTSSDTQQLTIAPKTLFNNDITVQGSATINKNLAVIGTADVQGATTLRNGLTVKGPLTVSGAASFGNNLTVAGTITTGGLNVGSLNVANITISNNLNLSGHIVPTGVKPTAVSSAGAGGGSVVVSGNDTAGTITIQTGGGPIAGELATVTFRAPFSTTPKVQLTPVNGAAAQLQYFATRSATFFSVSSASAPAANTSYTYDYLITQ